MVQTSQDGKTFFVKVHTPWELLAKEAELIYLKMPIKVGRIAVCSFTLARARGCRYGKFSCCIDIEHVREAHSHYSYWLRKYSCLHFFV